MSPRSFFLIVLKILGLYFLKNTLGVIVQFVTTILFIFRENSSDQDYIILVVSLLSATCYLLLTYLLIVKTGKLIDALQLEKGFTEHHFAFNWKPNTILTITAIIIGGLLLTIEIPNLIKQIYFYFQYNSLENYIENKTNITNLIGSSVKIIIGLLLIGERSRIVQWMLNTNDKDMSK